MANSTIWCFWMRILIRNTKKQIVELETPLYDFVVLNENPYAKPRKRKSYRWKCSSQFLAGRQEAPGRPDAGNYNSIIIHCLQLITFIAGTTAHMKPSKLSRHRHWCILVCNDPWSFHRVFLPSSSTATSIIVSTCFDIAGFRSDHLFHP